MSISEAGCTGCECPAGGSAIGTRDAAPGKTGRVQPRVKSDRTLTRFTLSRVWTRAYAGPMTGSVTASDVQLVLDDVITAVSELPDEAWELPAAGLAWTCRETVAHLLDDLGSYAMQLSCRHRHGDTYTRLVEARFAAPPAPSFLFWPEPEGGTGAIVDCVDAVGGLLVAVVATAPPERRGWHPYGSSDAAGFAAMGITEAALDLAQEEPVRLTSMR